MLTPGLTRWNAVSQRAIFLFIPMSRIRDQEREGVSPAGGRRERPGEGVTLHLEGRRSGANRVGRGLVDPVIGVGERRSGAFDTSIARSTAHVNLTVDECPVGGQGIARLQVRPVVAGPNHG